MAIVRILDENRTLREAPEIQAYLAGIGIDYERWERLPALSESCSADDILAFYSAEIEALKKRGGYVTADVIDVQPHTPSLEPMLARFSREHWHSEDEVRFILEGRGIFHIHPRAGASPSPVVAIEVEGGDLIRVPAGTWHWFDLCADRRIRAIRLFQDTAGWTPHYTGSGVEQGYQPLCLGPADLPGIPA